MTKSKFQILNDTHTIHSAYYFSQNKFRKKFLPTLDVGLCSALVSIWAQSGNKSTDFLKTLKNPDDALLSRIRTKLALGLYPLSAGSLDLGELDHQDKMIFEYKYGVSSKNELLDLLSTHNVSCFLELDIQRLHNITLLSQNTYVSHIDDLIEVLTSKNEAPDLAIIILRYGSKKSNSTKMHSHRMCLRYNEHDLITFFDPNTGEISIEKKYFKYWIRSFWKASGYNNFQSIEGYPMITLFFGKNAIKS